MQPYAPDGHTKIVLTLCVCVRVLSDDEYRRRKMAQ